MAGDFLQEKVNEIRKRVKELEPLHQEYLQLQEALKALEGGARRGPGRPTSSPARGGARKRRRRRRGGTRAEQAAKLVSESPGITVSEIATKLNIKPNYVYRVMHELQRDRAVKKSGRGYAPA